MYTIGRIGFGILFDKEIHKIFNKYDLDETLENNQHFHSFYSGSSQNTPRFIGVHIKDIDEIADVNLDFLKDDIKLDWDSVTESIRVDIEKNDISLKEKEKIFNWLNQKPYKLICWSTS